MRNISMSAACDAGKFYNASPPQRYPALMRARAEPLVPAGLPSSRAAVSQKSANLGTGVAFYFGVERPMPESTYVEVPMSQRNANILCLRDTLEHLAVNQQRLEWTEDAEAVHLLTENMIRDLRRCQRLCESLRRHCSLERVA